jgi:hypothetical protein
MCNNNQKFFNLSEDIKIDGEINNFSLIVRNKTMLENCCNFSYITNKLLVTKSGNIVYIFSTKLTKQDSTLPLLATFKLNVANAYAKVVIDEKIFIIDANCQITFSDSTKFY